MTREPPDEQQPKYIIGKRTVRKPGGFGSGNTGSAGEALPVEGNASGEGFGTFQGSSARAGDVIGVDAAGGTFGTGFGAGAEEVSVPDTFGADL